MSGDKKRKRDEKDNQGGTSPGKKPWGGRFKESLDRQVEEFTASLPFDWRLARDDIAGSCAHCRMLVSRGIISAREGELILQGLKEIEEEIEDGSFPFRVSSEDIHMNIEQRLIEKIGPVGGKLHTGRSRNDQVALDMHLFVKRETAEITALIQGFQEAIVKLAQEYMDVVIPGYTHLQRAQPVLLSHHLLAYFWMLQRDRERFKDSLKRTDMMPLGAGALSGTSFPIDREEVARELGFEALYENSMDAVSDRDFVLEFLNCSSLLIMHLSRLSEELVIWSSQEFSFVELDDAHATGSSMMPQKKNPDVPELVRAKTGRIYGNLLSLLTVFKALPLTYNKDMQEDKESLFDTGDTVKDVLRIYTELLRGLKVNRERINFSLGGDFSTATEIADFLALQGVPFREAHRIVGELVRYCFDSGKLLTGLSQEELAGLHPLLDSPEALNKLDPHRAVEGKNSRGGTAPEAVKEQISLAQELLQDG